MTAGLKSLRAVGLVCACAAMLAGCTGLRPAQTPAAGPWEEQRARLSGLTHWTASGKIALRTGEQAESASLLWEQAGDTTHLELSGPMGFAATSVDSDGEYLAIRRGDDYQRWSLQDPALETANEWSLPLASLQYWLRGIPAPDAPVTKLSIDPATQLPTRLEQQGWRVDYEGFARFGAFALPTRLQVESASTRARIILRAWQVPADT